VSNDRQENRPRRVLMVSYYFPPSGGPGVQRVLKFVHYLPARGFLPVVLTVPENAAFPVRDESLAAEIPPEAAIVRSPIREFYGLYARAAGRRRGKKGETAAAPPPNLVTTAATGNGALGRVLTWLRGAVFVPDGRMGWLPGGTRAGVRAVRDHGIEVVYASGPPFTAHWIARRVAERTGLPLVLDYRDPWTRAPFYPRRPPLARAIDERLERSCLRRARAVIPVNEAIRSDLLARHSDLDPGRFHVITNGWDPADFAGLTADPGATWTVTHTGTLPGGLPAAFPRALASLLRDDPALAEKLRVRFIGHTPPDVAARLTEPPLDRIVRIEPYRPHRASIEALLESRLLLLAIEDGPAARGILTGKLFEYIGSGVPILALVPEGEASALIERTGCGRALRGSDEAGIRAALWEAVAAFRQVRRPFGPPQPGSAEAYARPALTDTLAGILRQAIDAPGLAPPDGRG